MTDLHVFKTSYSPIPIYKMNKVSIFKIVSTYSMYDLAELKKLIQKLYFPQSAYTLILYRI